MKRLGRGVSIAFLIFILCTLALELSVHPGSFLSGRGSSGVVLAQSSDEDETADGTVLYVEGKVTVQRGESGASSGGQSGKSWEEAKEDLPLYLGDTVKTGERSKAILYLSGMGNVRLDEKSTLAVQKESGGGFFWRLKVAAGKVWVEVERVFKGEHGVRVETPIAVAAVKGTVLEVDATEESSAITVHEGEVEVESGGGVENLSEGETLEADRGGRRKAGYRWGSFADWNATRGGEMYESGMEKRYRGGFESIKKLFEYLKAFVRTGRIEAVQGDQIYLVPIPFKEFARQDQAEGGGEPSRKPRRARLMQKIMTKRMGGARTPPQPKWITASEFLVYANGKPASPAALQVGQKVMLDMASKVILVGSLKDLKELLQPMMKQIKSFRLQGVKGTVQEVKQGAVVVKTPQGETREIPVAERVRVRGSKTQFAELRSGDQVMLLSRKGKAGLIVVKG